jgi:hypothetical protein
MIKHVGKISDRKVAIVFREVPGEEHMSLIVYPDIMPAHIHDSVMKVLESDVGQTAENLGDAMFRSMLPDGRPMLQTLHSEGMIKKVQAKQVIVTPNATSHVNLEELNKIINEMKMGEDAVKRLADLDSQQGMTGKVRPRDDFGRELGAPAARPPGAEVAGSDAALALNDEAIAQNLADQAARMEAEAKGLLAESARIRAEAESLAGAKPKAKRGRQKKVSAANEA